MCEIQETTQRLKRSMLDSRACWSCLDFEFAKLLWTEIQNDGECDTYALNLYCFLVFITKNKANGEKNVVQMSIYCQIRSTLT